MRQNQFLSKIQVKMPGIYGGMGPMSHIMFEEALMDSCRKRKINNDQDHPVWIVASGSSTPDRTKSIEGGESSLAHMTHFAKTLENAGADFVVMICNTAHYYISEVQQNINIPIISMIETTAQFIKNAYPKTRKVGILATTGTLKTQIYHNALSQAGLEPIAFDFDDDKQKLVMSAIYDKDYGVKATGNKLDNRAVDTLSDCVKALENKGCDLVVAGCTEISLALKQSCFSVHIVDPLLVLAERVIDEALGTISLENEAKQTKPPSLQMPVYNFPNPNILNNFLEF